MSLWLVTADCRSDCASRRLTSGLSSEGQAARAIPPKRGLPLEWSETRNVVWKTPVPGVGWSSPVVAGGRIWLTTSVETGNPARGPVTSSLRVLAFDVATGSEVVNVEVFQQPSRRLHQSQEQPRVADPGSRGRPRLRALRRRRHRRADDRRRGSCGRRSIPYESQHGAGGSPILYGDLLIFSCDGNDVEAFVVALDKNTGKQRWKTNRRQPSDAGLFDAAGHPRRRSAISSCRSGRIAWPPTSR